MMHTMCCCIARMMSLTEVEMHQMKSQYAEVLNTNTSVEASQGARGAPSPALSSASAAAAAAAPRPFCFRRFAFTRSRLASWRAVGGGAGTTTEEPPPAAAVPASPSGAPGVAIAPSPIEPFD